MLFSLLVMSCTGSSLDSTSTDKPNIIYILADDLGYGELGVYGQQLIETPNIDALAMGGMKFNQHYSGAPVCAPSRCVLLTGKHAGHAFVRGNDEWGSRGKTWDYQKMFDDPNLEGQRPMPAEEITIAEVLKEAGYVTGMIGKWGLGAPLTESIPTKQGFDFFYGYNCQRQAHTYYPMHLWHNEEKVLLNNKFVNLHANLPEEADPNDPESYRDFELNDYAPTLMHEAALGFINDNSEDPFFLYYASPIPHLPLQAPRKWVDYYQNKFGPEEPFTGNSYYPNRTPKATYAAMISYLDEQVGELITALKKLGEYENTLIIFSSDNGPTYVGGVDAAGFNSAGPFREGAGLVKGSVNEGGVRVPMIAHWPSTISPGTTSEHTSIFYDVFPTLTEIAGIATPKDIDGISFLPALKGETQEKHDFLYWEFPSYTGQQAIRKGNWKAIRKNILNGNLEIELYNLGEDLQENNNVANKNPEVLQEMVDLMKSAHKEAHLDKFKMEALGDVKQAYLDAQTRAKVLYKGNNFKLNEGYFILNGRTHILGMAHAPKAVAILEDKLEEAAGYKLIQGKDARRPLIELTPSALIPPGNYTLTISSKVIDIIASDDAGFEKAIKDLLQLFDNSIHSKIEMHNPTWTLASLEVEI
jgi:arylsulfatase A-like enzyme